jgi:hypothetical protein
MKYFRLSEWDIKWRMSWRNFYLYMASIPSDDETPSTPPLEVKDADELF